MDSLNRMKKTYNPHKTLISLNFSDFLTIVSLQTTNLTNHLTDEI